MYKKLLILAILTLSSGILIAAQTNERDEAHCFKFTWLGHRFNNESVILNATCQDATRLAQNIPCELPLVASYDGSWPDVEYIWAHHSEIATCVLADNDVCARYTYYFNGLAENSTYMCTRAIDANDTAITNGCYEQTRGSYSTRVCLCRSVPGAIPCNSATMPYLFPVLSLITIIILLMY
ncbi:unnamed protein product, partial [Brenthis ino]